MDCEFCEINCPHLKEEVERLKAENKFLVGTLEEFRLGVAKDVAKQALNRGE